jgi:hypothetical protein
LAKYRDPFLADSLPVNKEGRLSNDQLEHYRRIVRHRRRHFITSMFAGLFGSGGKGLPADLRDGVVEVDEGTVWVTAFDSGPPMVSVDDRRMRYGPLTEYQDRAIGREPTPGRIYYLPRSKAVVNFERLPDRDS